MSNCYHIKITERMKLTFKKMVALVKLCSRLMYFPVILKYSKANYAYKMCICVSCDLLTFCSGSAFSLGRLEGAHVPHRGCYCWNWKWVEAELAGGLSWVMLLICKMLLWYINSKLYFCERWAVGSAWPLWRYATEKFDFFVCLWLFFLKAGSDLKRAPFCFGKWLLYRHFCSV